MQLDLFVDKENPIEIRLKIVEDKCEKVKVSSDNVRRGLFARHNELAKMYLELKQKYEEMAKEIEGMRCNNAKTVYVYGPTEDGNLFAAVDSEAVDRMVSSG